MTRAQDYAMHEVRPGHARRCRTGFTLFEMMLSLVVISLISLGVAGVLQTAVYGTSAQRELRRVAVRGRQLQARLNDSIRDARAVLAATNTYIVLWTGDIERNDQVNLNELQLIELTAGTSTLISYSPGSLGSNPVYPANSNFYTVARNAVLAGQLVGTPWGESIAATRFSLTPPTPTAARLVTWSLTFTNAQVNEPLIGSAALHAPGTPQ